MIELNAKDCEFLTDLALAIEGLGMPNSADGLRDIVARAKPGMVAEKQQAVRPRCDAHLGAVCD